MWVFGSSDDRDTEQLHQGRKDFGKEQSADVEQHDCSPVVLQLAENAPLFDPGSLSPSG